MPFVVGCAIATALVSLASPVAIALQTRLQEGAFATFLVAVVLTTWSSGLGAGLVATALAAFSLDFFVRGLYT